MQGQENQKLGYEITGFRNRKMTLGTPWRDEFYDVVRREQVRRLVVTDGCAASEKEPIDFSFIRPLQELIEVLVATNRVKDLYPLESLANLERLDIQYTGRKQPDFSCFTKLHTCYLNWQPKSQTLQSCKSLRRLYVSRYPHANCETLGQIETLEYLQLDSRKVTSLAGLRRMTNLKELKLLFCHKLQSIDEVLLMPSLETLGLSYCRRLGRLPSLRNAHKLRALQLENCGLYESVLPVSESTTLESFAAVYTYFTDPDLSPLLRMPRLKDVRLADKAYYVPSSDEVAEEVARRVAEGTQ